MYPEPCRLNDRLPFIQSCLCKIAKMPEGPIIIISYIHPEMVMNNNTDRVNI